MGFCVFKNKKKVDWNTFCVFESVKNRKQNDSVKIFMGLSLSLNFYKNHAACSQKKNPVV